MDNSTLINNHVINSTEEKYRSSSLVFISIKKYMAEFIGTYIFLFLGIGAIIVSHITNSLGNDEIAMVFGLSIGTLIYCLGNISGADFNPAVSIAKCIIGKLDFQNLIIYCIFQLLGGILACLTLSCIFGNEYIEYSITKPSNSIIQTASIEFILTIFLVSIILWTGICDKKYNVLAGLLIGTTITIEALVFGAITGASMNPVRTVAPALVSGNISYIYIYIIATILGGITSALIYKSLVK